MHKSTDIVWDENRLRKAADAAGVSLCSWNVNNGRITLDVRAPELWGVKADGSITFEDLSAHIHPTDRDRVRAAFSATRALVGPYEIDFRIMLGKEIRWISARGQGDDAGITSRTMFGIFLDVTFRKNVEEAHELLAGEMSHRVKNLLAIASALTTITSRSAASAADMACDLTSRLAALGRAHDLIHPVPGNSAVALLGDMLFILLAPYDNMGAFRGRVHVSVPRMGVGGSAATALALVFHELATNSVKYGALSAPQGTLDISCTDHGDPIIVVWTERGGPPVSAPPSPRGFGSKLLNRSMSGELGGSIDFDWAADGLIIKLQMNKQRILR